MRYVIDPTQKFDGAVITSMSDNEHSDYGGETIEQIRKRENNSHLTTISVSELKEKVCQYIDDLHNGPIKEISEEDYWWSYECVPPARNLRDMFFVGEPYYGDIYPFCFKVNGRYFRCRKRINTPKEQLEKEIAEYVATLNQVPA